MAAFILLAAGAWGISQAQLDLDCSQPSAARTLIGRIMLSEIEGAEDINRAAMWDAFGRCDAGPGRERCVERARQRYEAEWDGEKSAIETRYRNMLEDFQLKCHASPA